MYVVYALADPRDSKVHYVGMTDDVYKRFLAHIQGSGNNYEKNKWVHEMRAANIMIQMHHLEETDDKQYAQKREVYWINHYTSLGHPLANIVSMPPGLSAVEIGTFVARPTDKMLSDIQAQLLVTYYQDCGDVKKALSRIKSEKGRGLGTGYYKHAIWILDSQGLRRRA